MSYTLEELNEIAEALDMLDEDELDYVILEGKKKKKNKITGPNRKVKLAMAGKLHKIRLGKQF